MSEDGSLSFSKSRAIDPFFEDAVNQIFLKSHKQCTVMDGSIGLGKSTNWLMLGSYAIAQLVEPVRRGKRMVRESLWVGVRESENSAIDTFEQLIEEALFDPDVLALDDSPVKKYGSHPTFIEINHELEDGTFLAMKIECHGFNNPKAFNRLKSRAYMMALVPEGQSIPFNIIVTLIERCGRWRTDNTKISKVIDGVKYTLTGLKQLAQVMVDINIPTRPHALYTNYYDKPNKDELPYNFVTPPEPLIPMRVADVKDEAILEKYPVTRFEGKQTVWLPNPKCYNMTRHFEAKDGDGNRIPWTGYDLWYRELHRTDSEIRRYVLGRPDTVGGAGAVYKHFNKDQAVKTMEMPEGCDIYMGIDPGGKAAVEMCFIINGERIHFFKEFITVIDDGISMRKLLEGFVLPYCRKHLGGHMIKIVADPASTQLGKNKMMGHTESVLYVIRSCIRDEMDNHATSNVVYKIEGCIVPNQNTEARINSLGYFIDKGFCTLDPECKQLKDALVGGYQYKTLLSGTVSSIIDKENPYSDPAEAAQYPAVNILHMLRKNNAKTPKKSKRVTRLKHVRR